MNQITERVSEKEGDEDGEKKVCMRNVQWRKTSMKKMNSKTDAKSDYDMAVLLNLFGYSIEN